MAGESDLADSARTWGAQFAHATRLLAAAGSPNPEQEAAELLAHLLGVPVAVLAARPGEAMRPADVQTYATWIARRAGGVPVPYITGHLEFMGLDISISQGDPLIPQGTQRVVEAALQWARHHTPGELAAADMGTGCGAIALALAVLEPRFTCIYAVDASPETLATAHSNGARYLLNLVINWLDGRDLDVFPEPVDLVVCGQLERLSSGMDLLAHAPARLRPDGALICAVTDVQRPVATEALLRGEPTTLIWTESAGGDEPAIVLAQFSRFSGNEAGNNPA